MLLGAHVLDEKKLPKEREEAIRGIMRLIEEFRGEAFKYQKSKESGNRNRNPENTSPTNFISILGDRGSGKTSTLLTVHNKLRKENEDFDKNIILDIVDPAKFNVEENALGWIIYLFQNEVNEIIKKGERGYCDSKTHIKELKDAYEKLKDTYVKSRPYFRGGTGHLAEGTFEYKKINEEIIFSDMNLDSIFRKFIDSFVTALKKDRCQTHNCEKNEEEKLRREKESEPVIVVTFDDIDISPEHGYEILRSVLNYLKHPSIVVIMLGKYKTFKEGAIIDSIHREKILRFDLNESYVHETRSMIDERKVRAEEFIEKVLPFSYRYDLEGFTLEARLKFPHIVNDRDKDVCKSEVDSIENLLRSIKIYDDAKYLRLDKDNKYSQKDIENAAVCSIGDLFYSPILNKKELQKEYQELKKKLENNKNKQGKNTDEEDGDYRDSEDEILKYSHEIETGQVMPDISVYSNLLFKNPRGLINFQQRLKKEFQGMRLYYKTDGVGKSGSYVEQQMCYERNFEFIYKLYIALRNNVDLTHTQNDIKKIFEVDRELKRIVSVFVK